jgi:hypothetical protein
VIGQWDPYSFENKLNCCEARNVDNNNNNNNNEEEEE